LSKQLQYEKSIKTNLEKQLSLVTHDISGVAQFLVRSTTNKNEENDENKRILKQEQENIGLLNEKLTKSRLELEVK
jgi:hypothetical protein